jgi:tRNA modification GTPase
MVGGTTASSEDQKRRWAGLASSAAASRSTRSPVGAAQPALVTARQSAAVERALAHLRDTQAARAGGVPQDLLATSVRAALHAVGEVTGEAVDEAVLTEIFSRFCIGK